MLVRRLVSGVRSSWPASATRRRCWTCASSSAVSIALNAWASRAISSLPSTSIGSSRPVAATCSAAAVRRSTGRRPVRAIDAPAQAASAMPTAPAPSETSPRVRSTRSTVDGRLAEHEGMSRTGRHGHDAVRVPVRRDGSDALGLSALCDGDLRLAPRRVGIVAAGNERRAVGADEGEPHVGEDDRFRRHPTKLRRVAELGRRLPAGPGPAGCRRRCASTACAR